MVTLKGWEKYRKSKCRISELYVVFKVMFQQKLLEKFFFNKTVYMTLEIMTHRFVPEQIDIVEGWKKCRKLCSG